MSIDEKIQANLSLFRKFNDIKYRRFQDFITNNNVARVINSIPLLMHVNDMRLPGYVEGDVPYGIANYTPDGEAEKFIHTRFHVKNFKFSKKPFVQMLAVMGSIGTVAYSKESDFDYWVCIDRKSVSEKQAGLFNKKIVAIQNWAMKEINTEVHLFLNDIESVRNNIFAEDEDEAFGSTVGPVLKDEFFRSSIIIAGKYPFWWVVPGFLPDSEYYRIYDELDPVFRDETFIDLGNIYRISREDFLGAALFQLIKSLGNPFKSILKIGLLEKYLFGPEKALLLSQKIKSGLLKGNIEDRILDSYILMFEEVYEYYREVLEDKKLPEILRMNLYLKINPQLSKYSGMKKARSLPYKVKVMFRYVKEWGWGGKEIGNLDNFDNWDYQKIMAFWNQVKKFMLLSYQKISRTLPSMNLQQKISDSDFKLLSRKIKSHFSTEENKIDRYISFKDTPSESILYIEPIDRGIDSQEWTLSKRNTSSKDHFESTLLKGEKDLVKLLSWTAINQIFDPGYSRIKISSGYSRISQDSVVDLMNKLCAVFQNRKLKIRNEYLLRPAFNLASVIIFNFSIEKADEIRSIHHVYLTSWGESYIYRYRNDADIIHILGKVLSDGSVLRRSYDEYCVIYSPEPFKKIYKDIETTFKESYEFITGGDRTGSNRLVAFIGNQYLIVSRDGIRVTVDTVPNYIKMLTTLTLKPKGSVTHRFLGDDSRLELLQEIYEKRRPNFISIFYDEKGDYVFVYVINENGNIFTFMKGRNKKEEALSYIYFFSRYVINRINSYHSIPDINDNIMVMKVAADRFGRVEFVNESKSLEELFLVKYQKRKGMVLEVSRGGGETAYTVTFPDGARIGPLNLAGLPGAVTRYRSTRGGFPEFVSDISFSDATKEDLSLGTSLFFLEKYRAELVVNKALKG